MQNIVRLLPLLGIGSECDDLSLVRKLNYPSLSYRRVYFIYLIVYTTRGIGKLYYMFPHENNWTI